MQFRIFKHYCTNSFLYLGNSLRNFISKLFKTNTSQEVPYSLIETKSSKSLEESVLKGSLKVCVKFTSDYQVGPVDITSKRTKNRLKNRLRKHISSMSESNRLRTSKATFEHEFENAVNESRLHSKPKSSSVKSLRSVSVKDSPSEANAEGTTKAGTTAKFRTLGNKKIRKKGRKNVVCVACKGQISEIFQIEGYEEKITFLQLVRWIQEKIAVLKALPAASELTIEGKKIVIENVLEDVKRANRTHISKTASMNNLIELVEKTALSLLVDVDKPPTNLQGINSFSSTLKHLSAFAGAKTTPEEVQRHINIETVLNLFKEMQEERLPILHEMESLKMYIEHRTEEVQNIKEAYKEHFETVKDVFLKDSVSLDLRDMNLKLKTAAAKSEEFLNQYVDSIDYLMERTKTFYDAKVETERLLNKFLGKKVEQFFKAG